MHLANNSNGLLLERVERHSGGGPAYCEHALVSKILTILILLVSSIICGFIPYALDRKFQWTSKNSQSPRSAKAVNCLLYFGGGVLFATTFLHLLPEVEEVCADLELCNMIPKMPFNFPSFLMSCGFFLMYLLEEIMHTYMHHRQNNILKENKTGAAFERGHSVRRSVLMKDNAKENLHSNRAVSIVSHSSMDSEVTIVKSEDTCCIKNDGDMVCSDEEMPKCNTLQVPNHQEHNGHSHSHMPTINEDDTLAASLRGLGLVMALSLHELFEGMAIGLESTSTAVWFTFGAVSAHKLVLAFCVGMELLIARTRKQLAIAYILTFSIVSPIGIAIGILITLNQTTSAPSLASAILQGIACGTLLYVVFFEILSKNHAGWWAYLALLLGFALMFGLQVIGDDAESHSGTEVNCPA